MAAPNYPGNRNGRSRPNHRKQKWGRRISSDLPSGQRRLAELFDKKDSKIDFEMSLIIVDAIRGRCASFMILTARVS